MSKRAPKRNRKASRTPLSGPAFKVDIVALADLRPHPRNYREHSEDQLAHLVDSLKNNGVYRNVVVARDNTILAGHGVVLAARKLKRTDIPVIRLNVSANDPRALKVLAGDNEVASLALQDDRALSDMLKEINEGDGLLGTGYDERMLAALVFVTRPSSEIRDFDAAAEWVGMPEFAKGEKAVQLLISFETLKSRKAFVTKHGLKAIHRGSAKDSEVRVWSAWWPPRKKMDDSKSVLFEG